MTDHTRDDLAELEEALQGALAHDAGRVAPPERLGAILRDAHQPPILSVLDEPLRESRPARRTWLAAGAAAAAVVAAVSVAVAVADRGGTALPGATGTSTAPTGSTTGSSATGPTSGPTTPATGTGISSAPGDRAMVALPVYYIGTRAGGTSSAALVREFVPTDLGGTDTPSTRVAAALDRALSPSGTAFAAVGPGRVTAAVTSVAQAGIDVTLSSDTGNITPTVIQEAAITYTAQAAAALGDVPVTINLNPHTFGPLGGVGPFTRSSFPDSVLAPIWVDAPYRGQEYSSGRAITVSGIASVFEAQFGWQVLRGSDIVAQGTAHAAGAAPARTAYTFSISGLPSGSYTLRVFEPSARGDGSLAAETTTTFTIR